MTPDSNPEFKKWFGTSKVTNDDGSPKVVFHGTNQDIHTFDASRHGENTRAASSIAFFFTEDPEEAAEYAELAGRTQIANAPNHEKKVAELQKLIAQAEKKNDWSTAERLYLEYENLDLGAINADPCGQNIVPVYLSVKNPKILDMKHRFDGHVVAEAIKTAKQQGFDGLKLLNVFDPVSLEGRPSLFSTTQWIAFAPEQIKFAIGIRAPCATPTNRAESRRNIRPRLTKNSF